VALHTQRLLSPWSRDGSSPGSTHRTVSIAVLPSGSREELEIRAATIRFGTLVYEGAAIPPYVTDRFVWTQRKAYKEPYHLTITTDY